MGSPVVIVDAGPLVALFDRHDPDHQWATETLRRKKGPILTCESVVSEAAFILGTGTPNVLSMLGMIERGVLRTAFDLTEHVRRVRALIERYSNVPMSLADACLVRMTELHTDAVVWTLDNDFRVYRRHGRQAIPTLMPHND